MNLGGSGDSAGFEPVASAMPVRCSGRLGCGVAQLGAGRFVGLVFSRGGGVVWERCCVKCGV